MKLANKKSISIILSSCFLLTLFSCSQNNTPVDEPDEPIIDDKEEITFKFNYDENAISLTYDDTKTYTEGDNFQFKIELNDEYYLTSVVANDEELTKKGSSSYIFSVKRGENVIFINTEKYENYTISKYVRPENDSYYTMWKNRGYPHFNSIGDQKLLVIPVTIKDKSEAATEENRSKLEKAFFGASNELDYESLSSFYYKSSYGKLNISGKVTPWFDLNLTSKEISTVSADFGTYNVLEKAVNWVKETQNDIDLKDYDNDKDGFIDGIYLVYSALPFTKDSTLSSDTFWNFTFYNINNKDKANVDSPVAMTYSWSSIDMINYGAIEGSIDAHTYIHEFGHQLGLSDYYDTQFSSGGTPYTSPMGGMDMMDFNLGDHSPFSKFALNWVEPKVISGVTGTVSFELNSFQETGDFAILTPKNYTSSAFDEYFVIEYLTVGNDKSNLNYFDSKNGYKVTMYPDGRIIKSYSSDGIRITHVDARSLDAYNNFSTDSSKYVRTKFSNTASTQNGYYCKENNNSFVLTTLISANQSRNTMGTYFVANSSDLFKSNSSINFFAGKENSRASMIPYEKNVFNSGLLFNYTIKIDSISGGKAKITIS